ncbi:MAG: hypothetical protein MRJ65_16675 [Candidatus Brocadiaceae bacterium]|nr:hypothetical protein [Candidatus Brocadiaceae bacterium]
MTIVAGIDEAGYGPLLGPLVISITAFHVPDEKANCSLWELLKDAISPGLKGKKQRLVIQDSKKLYNARRGLKPLEEVIFSFLWANGLKITTFHQLLNRLTSYKMGALSRYPWYVDKDHVLPLVTNESTLLNYIDVLRHSMNRHDVRFSHANSCVITVREYNEQVRLSGNKSMVLFQHCMRLVSNLWEGCTDTIHLIVDKQGGRHTYAELLKKRFRTEEIVVLKESSTISSYELLAPQRKMGISFVEKGENICMATALASLFSKYLRELFMRLENHYWQQFVPNLQPTAGYYKDARRFLSDIAHAKKKEAIQDDILIRIK